LLDITSAGVVAPRLIRRLSKPSYSFNVMLNDNAFTTAC
jgi:hypothetical protein